MTPTNLVRLETPALSPALKRALTFSKADRTRATYARDWARFAAWSEREGRTIPASPVDVAEYVMHLDALGLKPATISVALAAVSWVHRMMHECNPVAHALVRETVAGVRRMRGTAQKQAPALTVADLERMLLVTELSLRGARDRAMLLVGFAGAFRRSELTALNVKDLDWREQGVLVTVRRSKTDQEGAGTTKAIAYGQPGRCPVTALRAWLKRARITSGPIFRELNRGGTALKLGKSGGKTVNRLIKRLAKKAGVTVPYTAHSLRSGFITASTVAGARPDQIRQVTGHKPGSSALEGYIRSSEHWHSKTAVL